MDGNACSPTPQPTKAIFDEKLAALEAVLAAMENHRIEGKNLTDQRDQVRTVFEQIFTQRGTYVELTSEGDGDWIASAGLPVRNVPTPTGILPAPLALRVDLNGEEGVMIIR